MTLEGVPPVTLQLGKIGENNTETVSFAYRNLVSSLSRQLRAHAKLIPAPPLSSMRATESVTVPL